MLIEALGVPQHFAKVLALIVACTSSYAHESAVTSGVYTVYARGYRQHAIKMARFNALYLRLCDSYKHGSNANSERDPSSKATAPMKQNR